MSSQTRQADLIKSLARVATAAGLNTRKDKSLPPIYPAQTIPARVGVGKASLT